MATVSLYCGTEANRSGIGPIKWGDVEVEFSTSVGSGGALDFRVYEREPEEQHKGERKMICSRSMERVEVRRFAEALKGLVTD